MNTKRFEIYAPVIIPTLCRYEHLKRCIDSLRRCTGAEYTDLYLGLDYPAKESHWEGYNMICDYVNQIDGFHKVIVIKRDFNFGPQQNYLALKELVRQSYDRFIFSEDDNEFSPNFLDYMNAGLVQFKDNPSVIRICGSKMTWGVDFQGIMQGYRYNIYPAKDYNASGVGFWFDKDIVIPYTKDSVLKSWRLTLKAFQKGYCSAISRMLYQLDKESQLPDVCIRLYCAFHDKYCIFPTISKVKNWGYDGTGENSDNNSRLIDIQELDSSDSFYMDDVVIRDYPEVVAYIKKLYGGRIVTRLSVMVRYVYYRITKKNMNNLYLFLKSLFIRARHH